MLPVPANWRSCKGPAQTAYISSELNQAADARLEESLIISREGRRDEEDASSAALAMTAHLTHAECERQQPITVAKSNS